ncbi:hypothetical protein AURDEDRAFT_165530 [Auricularia subglabra TFB-10046 SS5]|nr:hypothetical protein AURDEDRAFT_165530 [Auricularia subglabra TFB-10046 SS5]
MTDPHSSATVRVEVQSVRGWMTKIELFGPLRAESEGKRQQVTHSKYIYQIRMSHQLFDTAFMSVHTVRDGDEAMIMAVDPRIRGRVWLSLDFSEADDVAILRRVTGIVGLAKSQGVEYSMQGVLIQLAWVT